jgi:hypothetical protein
MTGNRHPKVALHYHPTGRDPGISYKSLRPDRKMTKKNAASSYKTSISKPVKLSTLLLGHAV